MMDVRSQWLPCMQITFLTESNAFIVQNSQVTVILEGVSFIGLFSQSFS